MGLLIGYRMYILRKRKQELEYIKMFTNEWQYKAYAESLARKKKKWIALLVVGFTLVFGYIDILPKVLEVLL